MVFHFAIKSVPKIPHQKIKRPKLFLLTVFLTDVTQMTIDDIDVTSMTNIIQMTCWAVNFPDLGAFGQSIHTVRQLTNDSSEVPVPGITTLLATEAVRLAEWTPRGSAECVDTFKHCVIQ